MEDAGRKWWVIMPKLQESTFRFVIDDDDDDDEVMATKDNNALKETALNDTLDTISTTSTATEASDTEHTNLELPTADELHKILQQLSNEEVATIQIAILQQLKQWSNLANSRQDTQFLHEMNESIMPVLECLESNLSSAKIATSCMTLLQALIQCDENTSTEELQQAKKNLANLTVALDGVELCLRSMDVHVERAIKEGKTSGAPKKSLLTSIRKAFCDDNFRTRSTTGQVETDYISVGVGDLDLCCIGDEKVFRDSVKTECTSTQAVEAAATTLTLLVPNMPAAQVSTMIKFVGNVVTTKLWNKGSSNDNTSLLLIAMIDCLTAATTHHVPCRYTAKKVVTIATQCMTAYPHSSKVNEHCCVLLKQTLPFLKIEQDWYDTGVLVALDNLHNNLDMSMVDAKTLATAILTELCEQ